MKCSSRRLQPLIIAIVINLCALPTAPAQTPGDPDPRTFIDKARASLVVVTGEDRDGQRIAPGLGFFMGANLIATDHQIVQFALRARVRIAGQDSDTEVKSRDNYQLASILRLATVGREPLTLGDSDKVAVNDKVFLAGNPKGSVTEAIVTKIGIVDGKRCFILSVPVDSNSRGGPVFNRRGEVVGVAAQNPERQTEGLAIPASYLMILRSFGEKGAGMGIGPGLPSLGPGAGQPGFGGGSKPGDQDPAAPATSVDLRPVILKNVRPVYTEQARRNQVQGIVMLRALVGEDGDVKQVRIIRGLPDGLDEQAVAAARQMKFRPAMKNGQPVSYWIPLSVEFNLR